MKVYGRHLRWFRALLRLWDVRLFGLVPLSKLLCTDEDTLDRPPDLPHDLKARFGKVAEEGIANGICFVLDEACKLIKLILAPFKGAGDTAPERGA